MLMIDPMFDEYVAFGRSDFRHAWFAWHFAGDWRDGSHLFICPDWSLMLHPDSAVRGHACTSSGAAAPFALAESPP